MLVWKHVSSETIQPSVFQCVGEHLETKLAGGRGLSVVYKNFSYYTLISMPHWEILYILTCWQDCTISRIKLKYKVRSNFESQWCYPKAGVLITL